MLLKEYQQDVVNDFENWYNMLKKDLERVVNLQSDIKKAQDADLSEEYITDMHSKARLNLPEIWQNFKNSKNEEWKKRIDHAGNSIPHVCVKVPTGGGKTRIAAAILQKTRKTRGLVIWMIPTKAIEVQTTDILKDKEHPIRQMLDMYTDNRVLIVKKDNSISKYDLENNLCIMPLMLQSTNRKKNKDFLRMNRSNGQYIDFFPPTDDVKKIKNFNKNYPGLDVRDGTTNIPETSLKNVMRMYRPVIILDEAHKASAKNFGEWAKYVNELGPSMVIELTATPNEEYSNTLRTVTGKNLLDESMIKKSIILAQSAPNWQLTLNNAVKQLKILEKKARLQETKYIRPIMVIRVELTDPKLHESNTHTGAKTHAIDAQNYLTDKLKISREQIAIKSSTIDELRGQNLMERRSPIRYIITKNALMEGWDCPFAYMLVILDNLQSQTSLTQLLGRIMRQPYITYTNDTSLNDCYVYCMYKDVENMITLIQKQLHDEGFGSMKYYVRQETETTKERRTNTRRKKFHDLEIHLPMVSHKEGDKWVDVNYEKHIISDISWEDVMIGPPENIRALEGRMKKGIVIDILSGQSDDLFVRDDDTDGSTNDMLPSMSEWVAAISDLVPNAWNASRIIRDFWCELKISQRLIKTNERDLQSIFIEKLKAVILNHAESIFRKKIKNKMIKFDMQVPSSIFKMHDTYEITPGDGEENLLEKRKKGKPVQLSLFESVYKEDFASDPERLFAQYLDDAKAIEWWHRIAAKNKSEYYLRGWKKDKIYPDFIAMFNKKNKRILNIYETKGMHLGSNNDTKYKRKVLKLLGDTLTAGKMTITGNKTLVGDFMIVLEDDMRNLVKTGVFDGKFAKAMSLKVKKTP